MKTVNEYISEYIASLKEVSQGDMKVQVNNVDIFYMGQDYDIPVHRVGIFRDILCEGQKYSQCMFIVVFPVFNNRVHEFYEQAVQLLKDGKLNAETKIDLSLSWSSYEILIHETKTLFAGTHYWYLDEMLESFWKEVFGKAASEMFCGGMVSAHGDKAYSYKQEWKEAGINFYRGSLLYLLTYTKELGDTPKHESGKWVIDNYYKYLLAIQRVEAQILEKLDLKLNSKITSILEGE